MDDLSTYFEEFNNAQELKTKERLYSIKKSILYRKKRLRKKEKGVFKSNRNQAGKVEVLSDEFLEELAKAEETGSSNNRKSNSEKKKKSKKRLVVTSSLIDNADYIPLETNVTSTNFKIARLDKDSISDSRVQKVTEFLNSRLYGNGIRRQPSKDLLKGVDKLKAKRSLRVK